MTGARTLDRPEPPPTLWSAIEGALAESETPLLAWRRFFVRGFALGGLAGAAVVVLALLGIGVVTKKHGGWSVLALLSNGAGSGEGVSARGARPRRDPGQPQAQALDPLLLEAEAELEQAAAAYERSIAKLQSLLARTEQPRWSPDARSRFLESLARLDQSIERSRVAARSTPGDSAGSEMLFAAYRSKIDFLAAAVHRGGPREMFREGRP